MHCMTPQRCVPQILPDYSVVTNIKAPTPVAKSSMHTVCNKKHPTRALYPTLKDEPQKLCSSAQKSASSRRPLMMLPTSLLALMASLVLPLIAATSTPVCIPSAEGYQLEKLDTLYQTFCSDLSKSGFSASQEVYGVPVISLSFVPTNGVDKCNQTNCLSTFGALTQSCKPNLR
jgi:hypothetical protein